MGVAVGILFVGKVGPSKGADVLTQAACQLANDIPDLRLRLVGPEVGDTVTRLQAMAEESGHPRLLDFAGGVPRDQLPAEMVKADVFAVPSPYEGGPGYVYLEAMACGLPVVGCSGSGVEETVRHGDTGMLVAPGDYGQLAHVLRELRGAGRLPGRVADGPESRSRRAAGLRESSRRQ